MKCKKYTLEELVSIKYGKSQKKVVSENGTIPIYGTGGQMGYATEFIYDKPSVLIGRKGTISKVRYVEHPFWTVDTSFYTIVNTDIVIPKYLYYVMSQIDLNRYNEGTTIPSLRKETLNRLEFYIPSLEEQKRILEFLEPIDNKIKINDIINNNLLEQADSIFKSWFIDFKPFNNKFPTDWNNGTIEDLSEEIICGKTPSTKKKEYYGNDIPFITIPDMHNSTYIIKTERYLSILGADSQPKKTLPKNSICVSCIGTAGLVSLVSIDSQTNQQINSIIPKKNISPYYIYLLMRGKYDEINKYGQGGSTIVNLNKREFSKLEVTIPSNDILLKFDKIVKPMFEVILNNQNENEKLLNLRNYLIPNLINGIIDVSQIDI